MKRSNILSFLFGGLTFLTIGAGVATSTDVLTVKPSVPKSVYHETFDDYSKLSKTISAKSKSGFIVKQIVTDGYYDSRGFIVMEKY